VAKLKKEVPAQPALSVYDDIRVERARQDEKWGGPKHDDEHSPGDWYQYIVEHAEKAILADTPSEGRRRFIEAAALAVAAVEATDRQSVATKQRNARDEKIWDDVTATAKAKRAMLRGTR
jgi:hypothetical protein